MAKLSNEELKDILIKRIEKIENSDLVDKKTINEESVKALAKHLSLGNEIPALAQSFSNLLLRLRLFGFIFANVQVVVRVYCVRIYQVLMN